MGTKSVADKPLIKPRTTVWSSHPDGLDLIKLLPEGVHSVDGPERATNTLLFAEAAGSLWDLVHAHQDRLARPATFWAAYPQANRVYVNRDTLRPIPTAYRLRPIGQVAVDEIWSAMRFRPNQEGETPVAGGR